MAVNWNLAGPGFDPLQVLQSYGAAQQQQIARRQQADEYQARELAANALNSGDFSGATAALIRAGQWQAAGAIGNLADDARKAKGRDAFAAFVRGGAPVARPAPVTPTSVATQALPAQPTDAAPAVASQAAADGEIVVEAKPTIEQQMAALAEIGGPELVNQALGYRDKIASLDKAQREQLDAETEVIASFVPQLLKLRENERAAFLEQNRAFLNQRGIDDREIANVDVSDAGLATLQRSAVGVKAALQMDQDQAQFEARQAQDESQFRRSQATTLLGQARADARAREANAIAAGGVGKQVQKTETDLRKEFEGLPEVKTFKAGRTAYNQIRTLAANKNATAQDDIAAIFTFMKTLDPQSTVREGEFATAQNAQGVPDTIRNLYNRAKSGNRLNVRQRVAMANTAGRAYAQQRDAYNNAAKQFRGYAASYGVDPNRVAGTFSRRGGTDLIGAASAPQSAPKGAITVDGFPGVTIERVGR